MEPEQQEQQPPAPMPPQAPAPPPDPLADLGPSMPAGAAPAHQNGILSALGVPQSGDPGMPPLDAPKPDAGAPPSMPNAPSPSGGSSAVPDMQLATPPPAPIKPKAPPLAPNQQAQVNAIGAKAEAMLSAGDLNKQVIANDIAQTNLDDQQKQLVMKNLEEMDAHIKHVQELGRQQAQDMSGKKYWDDESTGGKIGRVLLGVITLGGSEYAIRSNINRQVAVDQKNLDTENNTFALMLERGKTREQAAAIDAAKQAHLYVLGLDRIGAKYSAPSFQAKIAALKAGIQKDTSTALLADYHQQQQNSVQQQQANTGATNAKTDRMRLMYEMGKPQKPDLEAVKHDDATTFKKLDGSLGKSRTPDEAKKINEATNAFNSATRAITKIVGVGSLGDKPGEGTELTLGHSLGGTNHKLIEDQAKAIDTAVAQLKDGGMKLSTRNEQLVREFSDPNAFFQMNSTTVRELNELKEGLRQDLVNMYSQAEK